MRASIAGETVNHWGEYQNRRESFNRLRDCQTIGKNVKNAVRTARASANRRESFNRWRDCQPLGKMSKRRTLARASAIREGFSKSPWECPELARASAIGENVKNAMRIARACKTARASANRRESFNRWRDCQPLGKMSKTANAGERFSHSDDGTRRELTRLRELQPFG